MSEQEAINYEMRIKALKDIIKDNSIKTGNLVEIVKLLKRHLIEIDAEGTADLIKTVNELLKRVSGDE